MSLYSLNSAVTVSAAFTVYGGALTPVDPTTVTLSVVDPTGAETVYSGGQLTRAGVGLYSYIIVGGISGLWRYRWQGTGACIAGGESAFQIDVTAVP